ncbi:MAG: T9SS type A sorting domain-containing protein, partial [Calditrichaeota bacterium]|nr:T9SS type A sorting domain-containing protein [Calditrichota bacterium]
STVTDIGAFYYHQSAVEPLAITAPTVYALHPNWPNPFNPRTTIPYDVAQAGQVRLMIFNVLGQEVARLVDGHQLAGSHTISWDATNSPSGIYLCRMEASGFAQTRKLVLLK